MTVTEASRDVLVADTTETEPARSQGLAGLVGSGDPRTTGKLFVGTSLLVFLGVAVLALLVGLEQADLSSNNILRGSVFNQVASLSHLALPFLVILPLLLGVATAVVPLQVGASTVAFPRASAAAYWLYLLSAALIAAAYIADGGAFGGELDAVGLFVVAMVALVAALSVATISIMATVLTMRAPGMGLRRVPLFSWSMLVAGCIWLLTLAALGGLLILYQVDVFYGSATVFEGGPDDLYDQIRWVMWQPAVYAFAIPALGIIGDIVPVFAQRRLYRHTVAMVLIGLFGALSFGAWLQLGAVSRSAGVDVILPDDQPWLYEGPWMAVSAAALLPLLGLLGLWNLTLLKGRMRLQSPLLLSLGAGLVLVVGVAAGLGTMLEPVEVFGTSWVTGQSAAVLIGTLIAALAGIVFWAPKLYGNKLPETAFKPLAPLFVIGALLFAVPQAIAGLLHQPWLLPTHIDQGNSLSEEGAVEGLNLVAVIGVAVVGGGVVLAGLALLRAALSRATVGDDPWTGHTLEWTTSSPPPVGNFASLPEITSEAPLYDQRHAEASGADGGADRQEVSA